MEKTRNKQICKYDGSAGKTKQNKKTNTHTHKTNNNNKKHYGEN